MKFKSQQLIGIALGLVPLAAYSEIPMYQTRTVQNITFALTITSEQAALYPKDDVGKVIVGEDLVWDNDYSIDYPTKTVTTREEGYKMVTERISNKEILNFLLGEGVIGSITGYSISVIQDTEVESKSLEDYGDNEDYKSYKSEGPIFYLTKKGMEPIDISEYIHIRNMNDVATGSMKMVKTTIGDKESWKANGKSCGKSLVGISFRFGQLLGDVSGVGSWADTLKSFGSELDQFYAWMPDFTMLNHVVGRARDEYYDEYFEEYYYNEKIIDGSICMGAGSLYTLSVPR